jgi:hypothetical protein
VHQALGNHFLGAPRNPNRYSNNAFSVIFGEVGLSKRRPDLVEMQPPSGGEIYEIKPKGDFFQGLDQLASYIDYLDTIAPATDWRAGESYRPLARVPVFDGLLYANVSPPYLGVIEYELADDSLVDAKVRGFVSNMAQAGIAFLVLEALQATELAVMGGAR